jgi:hypothetical protein
MVQKKYRKVGIAGTKQSTAVKKGTVIANQGTSFPIWWPLLEQTKVQREQT